MPRKSENALIAERERERKRERERIRETCKRVHLCELSVVVEAHNLPGDGHHKIVGEIGGATGTLRERDHHPR